MNCLRSLRKEKYEIRSTKSETNPKWEARMPETFRAGSPAGDKHPSGLARCLEHSHSDMSGYVSDIDIRISDFAVLQPMASRKTNARRGGMGLGVSGLIMQAITGNSMASPFTTGLSNAAAMGAAVVIVFELRFMGSMQLSTVCGAFVMALICSALVLPGKILADIFSASNLDARAAE